MSLIEAKNLSVSIENHKIFDGVSFSIEKGQALAIIGPNGSGKTTLLKAILGSIKFNGEINKDVNLRIGYVPQKLDIERNLPINVNEFLALSNIDKSPNSYSFEEALSLVGLRKDFGVKGISELSSGEFQRVLIALAIINHPNLLLFDEPTASVDVAGQETVYELLHRLQDDQKISLILVSHDLSIVYKYADRVLCLNQKQICYGPPKDILTPDELFKLYGGDAKYYLHQH